MLMMLVMIMLICNNIHRRSRCGSVPPSAATNNMQFAVAALDTLFLAAHHNTKCPLDCALAAPLLLPPLLLVPSPSSSSSSPPPLLLPLAPRRRRSSRRQLSERQERRSPPATTTTAAAAGATPTTLAKRKENLTCVRRCRSAQRPYNWLAQLESRRSCLWLSSRRLVQLRLQSRQILYAAHCSGAFDADISQPSGSTTARDPSDQPAELCTCCCRC